jgi:hypothetical protein
MHGAFCFYIDSVELTMLKYDEFLMSFYHGPLSSPPPAECKFQERKRCFHGVKATTASPLCR